MTTGFLISAPTSGSGKTTIARGLMSLFTAKGYKVQPFKCGPDYIDTKFHTAVCGRPSVNLDTFMATPEHVRELYDRYGGDADVRVVEGMMGLFDGYDRDAGSSAEVARVLGLPVVLVVDARSAAYSMAALISGFVNFHDDVTVAGVIFNRVGSPRHAAMLQQVCDDLEVECFGYLPKKASLEQGSRYLGLDFSQAPEQEQLVELLEQNVNWQRLLELTSERNQELGNVILPHRGCCKTPQSNENSSSKMEEVPEGRRSMIPQNKQAIKTIKQSLRFHTPPSPLHLRGEAAPIITLLQQPQINILPPPPVHLKKGVKRTLIARNAESFSFIYQEVIDLLENVEFFNPETDVPCLDDVALLYLPGGYPEKHLEALVKAEATRHAIKDYAERGGHIVAECGGMMYLCDKIVTDEGEFPMCGVLPYTITARHADRKLSLGYRRFVLDGKEYRGHEFHYTQFLGEAPQSAAQVMNAKGEPVPTPVIRHKNVLASYTHLYNIK